VVSLAAGLALAGCGSSGHGDLGCNGLPTAKRTSELLILFGSTKHLTRGFLCGHYGKPNSARAISGGREIWTYGSESFTLRNHRVIGLHAGKVPIGG
jgi:hypothetical protein